MEQQIGRKPAQSRFGGAWVHILPAVRAVGDCWRDRSGQALVEAALVFPMLISVFLGVSEFSQAFTVKRRLETAANAAADLVARTASVATADLTGTKAMIDEILKPYSTTPLGLTISSVVADQDNATRVAWSYAQGSGATARTSGAAVTLPPDLTEPNSSIIFAEVNYTFRSTLAHLIIGDVAFTAEAYLRPRASAQVTKSD
jgi:Flp pilus assembly protein TadG